MKAVAVSRPDDVHYQEHVYRWRYQVLSTTYSVLSPNGLCRKIDHRRCMMSTNALVLVSTCLGTLLGSTHVKNMGCSARIAAIQGDGSARVRKTAALSSHPMLIRPQTGVRHTMRIAKPKPGINYTLLQVYPRRDVDYSVLRIDPNIRQPKRAPDPNAMQAIEEFKERLKGYGQKDKDKQ